MKYTTLGKTGIEVSRICVGCMSYGKASEDFHQWTLGPEDTQAMVAHAIDLGVNFFDTANIYSFGTSEEYLGRALKNIGVPRDQVVIASKVFFNEGQLSPKPFSARLTERSGASAMYGYQFHNMQICAERNGWTLFSTMQNHYNLMYREDERELIPVCEQYGVSRIPYSPLAGGHLTHRGWESGTARSNTDKTIRKKYDASKENDLEIIERVAVLSERLGVTMTEVALAWTLAKGVAAPIVGATKVPHFDAAVRAVDLTLSREDIVFLEEPYKAHEIVGALARTDSNGI